MKKYLIALLDKEYPPYHSFVDGFLSSKLLRDENVQVFLFVSKKGNKKIVKYNSSICFNVLLERTGVNRFLNFFVVLYWYFVVANKMSKMGIEKMSILVRNEPVYLYAISLFKRRKDKVIFQQSFPHEKNEKSLIKRYIANKIYKKARRSVSKIISVSPLGLKRISEIFQKDGIYIPLLNSEKISDKPSKKNDLHCLSLKEDIKFIYVGSHKKDRGIDLIVEAIDQFLVKGFNAKFYFYGGSKKDISYILTNPKAKKLSYSGDIVFCGIVERPKLLSIMSEYDVGLSLIPSTDVFKEASPTKLTEYMGAGLAVLASRGIDLQEEMVLSANAGILVDWNIHDVVVGMCNICSDRRRLEGYKLNSWAYANDKLNYGRYVKRFCECVF